MLHISDNDLASFVVCPEAWRLKTFGEGEARVTETRLCSEKDRKEWKERQTQFAETKLFTRVVYVLLFLVFLTVLAVDQLGNPLRHHTGDVEIPQEILTLLFLLGGSIFLWDLLERRVAKLSKATGLERSVEILEETSSLASEKENLSSHPDSIIRQDDILIPVDRVPTQKKVRDRHVIKMLLHLKLLGEQENTQIPYGMLLMGKENRQSKVLNNPERQQWLESVIAEMREIADGKKAKAKPQFQKCKGCDVSDICRYSAFKP